MHYHAFKIGCCAVAPATAKYFQAEDFKLVHRTSAKQLHASIMHNTDKPAGIQSVAALAYSVQQSTTSCYLCVQHPKCHTRQTNSTPVPGNCPQDHPSVFQQQLFPHSFSSIQPPPINNIAASFTSNHAGSCIHTNRDRDVVAPFKIQSLVPTNS